MKTITKSEFYKAVDKMNKSLVNIDGRYDIEIFDGSGFLTNDVIVKVCWSAKGMITTDEAAKFANKLQKAINLAEEFNKKYDGYTYID